MVETEDKIMLNFTLHFLENYFTKTMTKSLLWFIISNLKLYAIFLEHVKLSSQ